GAEIHTDEHKSYNALGKMGYIHKNVCHKYNFLNPVDGTHTQNVESINNCLKYEIKKRKGVQTGLRKRFLAEFIWNWNNKSDLFNYILNLIKV
ncbi:hypothetical protein H312_01532, partial [Anncaliia algerae PRA339]